MNRADTFVLHIGLPKTATTYLQKEVFPTVPAVRYLGIPRGDLFASPQDLDRGRRTLTACVNRSAEVWEGAGEAVLEEVFGCERAARPRGDVLVSDEGVGRSGSRPALLGAHLRALRRRAEVWGFERVRILCVIRRQDHWLASHYAQISDRNPESSQEDFEAMIRETVDPAGDRYGFGMLLDYAALTGAVEDAVGAENLLVLPYERLAQEPVRFLRSVYNFLEADAPPRREGEPERRNVRSAGGEVWELRPSARERVLRLRPARLAGALGLPNEIRLIRNPRNEEVTKTIRLTPPLRALISDAYRRSNRSLENRYDLRLDRLGYDL